MDPNVERDRVWVVVGSGYATLFDFEEDQVDHEAYLTWVVAVYTTPGKAREHKEQAERFVRGLKRKRRGKGKRAVVVKDVNPFDRHCPLVPPLTARYQVVEAPFVRHVDEYLESY